MTNLQLILLICVIAVVVIAAIIFAVVRKKRNASSQSAASSVKERGKAAETGEEPLQKIQGQPASPADVETATPLASAPKEEQQERGGKVAAAPREEPESNASRLVRLRGRLAGSGNPFGKALFAILSRDNLSEADWEDVEDTLLLADVGAQASEQIVDSLRSDARVKGEKDPQAIREMLRERLLEAVGTQTDRSLVLSHADTDQPSVVIMVGVNGTGKTTTAGKLGRLLLADGKKVIMGAADTFRAAAADQLETWGKRVGIDVVRSDHEGADPASVAFDAAEEAQKQNADVLIIDTAGRLQNKANLMDELGKIRRVVEKTLPVEEVLLVLDATTGQNGMSQARVFAQAIGITGVVLTKLDGSAKGGIVISVQRELGVPVKLVGLGEGPDDLAVFDPSSFVEGILGE